jgi:hypothetical protein
MLHVQHEYYGHLWCGIGALSAALRIPTSEAQQIIKLNELRNHIKPVSYEEMNHALVSRGAKTSREWFPRDWDQCPKVSEWYDDKRMESNGYLPSDITYVMCILGHWIVIQGDEWVCSMNQNPRKMNDCPYSDSRVKHVISFNSTDYQITSGSYDDSEAN